MIDFSQFHFLRPFWLLALLPLAGLVWAMLKRRLGSRGWEAVCDPALLPHVLIGGSVGRRRWPAALVSIAGILGIVALAGPVWNTLPQPVFSSRSALVIVLDMNRTMDSSDVSPSRLVRARYKVDDVLKRRIEGLTALVVYSGDAFTVAPLTDDTATIESQLSALSTDIMPSSGDHPELALKKAVELFRQSGANHGQILLICDDAGGGDAVDAARDALSQGYRVYVMGVGTRYGAPVPLADGSFLKDDKGRIVIPALKEQPMRELAAAGGGQYMQLQNDDSDLKALAGAFKTDTLEDRETATRLHTDVWREQGPWLLLVLLPLAALAFRRGALLALAFMLLVPVPRPAAAFDWSDLWLRPDQQAKRALDHGDANRAAKLFNDQSWKGVAQYRAGNFDAAAKALDKSRRAEDLYNLGNALAREGRYQQAIAAYNKALSKNPDDADARYNRDLVKKALKKQQQQRKQGNGKDSKQGKKSGNQQNNQGKQDQDRRNSGNGKQSNNQNQQSQDKSGKDANNRQQGAKPQAGKQPPRGNKLKPEQQNAKDQRQMDRQSSGNGMNKQPADQDKNQQGSPVAEDDTRQSEQEQADEQWLRRIPDDPGGLLRRKFLYEYQQRHGLTPQADETW